MFQIVFAFFRFFRLFFFVFNLVAMIDLPRGESRSAESERTGIDALPNEIIVSIVASTLEEPEFVLIPDERERRRSTNLRWVRETFPLVCRRWRDLSRSQAASPLHQALEVDLVVGSVAGHELRRWEDRPRSILLGERVVRWAKRRADSVRTLRVFCPAFCQSPPLYFTSEHLAELVKVLGPRLTEIEIDLSVGSSLAQAPFWRELRDVVAPAGTIRKLKVESSAISLTPGDAVPEGDVGDAFLSRLTGLEELTLRKGLLRAFPASVLALKNLRLLNLSDNRGVSLPPGISSLERLESLEMELCILPSLPEEIGALTSLTSLKLRGNGRPWDTGEALALPASLGGLAKSLRHLDLSDCLLRTVPAVVGELKSLEHLDVAENEHLRGGVSAGGSARLSSLTFLDLGHCDLSSVPPAVLSSMPRLRVLKLHHNRLTSLPEELGQRLPQLREIDLSCNDFERVAPLRALGGASSLEKIDVSQMDLFVDRPLDPLFESFPRLREVRVSGSHFGSLYELQRFAARMRERDPTAVVEF